MENNSTINWQNAPEHLRKQYPQLNEDDVRFEPGKEEETLERLQVKLNKTKYELRGWLSLLG